MKQQCIDAVQRAAGRVLKAAEIQGIEDRILKNKLQLAREDRQAWQGMSEAERLQAAAKRASDELIADAIRKKQAVIKDGQIMAGIQAFADSRVKGGGTALDAINRKLSPARDLQAGTSTVTLTAKAVYSDLTRGLEAVLDQTGKWWGLFTDKDGVVAIVRELHGEDSGIPEAKAAAKAIKETGESARKQMNAEGGNIGRLEDYSMPSFHDQMKVWKAGAEKWAADIMGKLKREKYVNEDGTLMSDEQLGKFLTEAWKSLAWNGQNKVDPGKFNAGTKRADRGSAHRQIHFKDSESFMEYQNQYGTGDAMELIFGHYNRIAKDIALVKELGSNPDRMVEHLISWAKKRDVTENGVYFQKADAAAADVEGLYKYIAGYTEPVASETLKHISDTLTGINVASRLGSATISALNDQATLATAARAIDMPIIKYWRNQLSALNIANREEKRWAMRQGLSHEAFSNDLQRWGAENLTQTWAGKMGATIMKINGLNALTRMEKRSWGLAIYDMVGQFSREHESLSSLHPNDAKWLSRAGVTEQDFQVWRKAEVQSRNGANDTVLTPDAIYAIPDDALKSLGDPTALKRDAAQRLIGAALLDTDVAVPTPGERERFEMYGHTQRGTWKGELWRQFMLFKSTPYTQFRQHWARMMDQGGAGSSAKYAAAYLTLATMTGAFTMELNEILSGKDPKDFVKNPVRAGLAAVLKGGGLGFYGDFMFSDKTLQGQTGALAGMMGPTASDAEALTRLVFGNAALAQQGKKTHTASQAADLVKSHLPGVNLWYAKAVINHLWAQNIQEALNPGYGARTEARMQKEFGQTMWWHYNEDAPQRPPNLGAAFGQ